ncbi:YybH family protein [Tumebacillus lipolyticus]|uniref:YybH family protein n=1 Tax=Tumebacillus lipolyticus TaxID=1280370 RepID=A0ABW5A1R5_9BACL
MDKRLTSELNEFMQRYEEATNSHDFEQVAELIAADAVYWFTDNTCEGVAEIGAYFRQGWETIREEVYSIRGVRWIAQSDSVSTCTYEYHWQGYVNGEFREGGGRGANVLAKRDGRWKIVHEHLSN